MAAESTFGAPHFFHTSSKCTVRKSYCTASAQRYSAQWNVIVRRKKHHASAASHHSYLRIGFRGLRSRLHSRIGFNVLGGILPGPAIPFIVVVSARVIG